MKKTYEQMVAQAALAREALKEQKKKRDEKIKKDFTIVDTHLLKGAARALTAESERLGVTRRELVRTILLAYVEENHLLEEEKEKRTEITWGA